eukprot:4152972-Prymnesium_polylepis.1
MLDAFNVNYHVPTLQKAEALTVLQAMGAKNIAKVEPCLAAVIKGMPIKKVGGGPSCALPSWGTPRLTRTRLSYL